MFLLRYILYPVKVFALEDRSVVLATGIRIPFTQAMSNLTGFLATSVASVCTLIFLIGAGQLVISHGDENQVSNGKKMMISALVGMAIALSAYGIVRTILYFLYEAA